MEMKTKNMNFKRSNKGLPCLWERMRKFPNMQRITCILNSSGESKEAIFNRIGANASLVPIREDDLVLKVFFDKEGIGISIFRLVEIDKYSNEALVEIVKRKASGSDEWINNDLSQQLTNDVFIKIEQIIEKITSDDIQNK